MYKRCRHGTASVELAICLPLFVLVVFGAVETCSLIHLKETLKTASYEAARLAAKGTDYEQAAVERATQIVTSRGVIAPSVTFQPTDLSTVAVGGYVTARVSVDPAAQDSTFMLPATILGSAAVSSTTTMVKESE